MGGPHQEPADCPQKNADPTCLESSSHQPDVIPLAFADGPADPHSFPAREPGPAIEGATGRPGGVTPLPRRNLGEGSIGVQRRYVLLQRRGQLARPPIHRNANWVVVWNPLSTSANLPPLSGTMSGTIMPVSTSARCRRDRGARCPRAMLRAGHSGDRLSVRMLRHCEFSASPAHRPWLILWTCWMRWSSLPESG